MFRKPKYISLWVDGVFVQGCPYKREAERELNKRLKTKGKKVKNLGGIYEIIYNVDSGDYRNG